MIATKRINETNTESPTIKLEERPRFEIKLNPMGRYYFVFRVNEGLNPVVSRSFAGRSQLEKCLANVRDIAPFAQISNEAHPSMPPFFQVEKVEGGYLFSLIGFEGEYVLSSELYENDRLCLEAIHVLREKSFNAMIVDHT